MDLQLLCPVQLQLFMYQREIGLVVLLYFACVQPPTPFLAFQPPLGKLP